ncbi:MAG: signal recognition particle receptor subunit alpha, partial [Gammaproteobacteria bacterium]
MAADASEERESAPTLFARLRSGLAKTRAGIGDGLATLLLGEKVVDEAALEDLETALLMADAGVETTKEVVAGLTARVKRRELANVDALFQALAAELTDILAAHGRGFRVDTEKKPYVVLMVGVNGTGKTTSMGKLAHMLKPQRKSDLLAAGDTFRAAAVEQLVSWGERVDVPVVAQGTGADSASVIYDAVESAKARGIDVVIADTA